jgi:hypothetical protein
MAQSVYRRATGRTAFDSRKEQEIILCSTALKPALGPAQPPSQWVPWAPSPAVKRKGRATDHSPPTNVKLKNGRTIPPLPHMSSPHAA